MSESNSSEQMSTESSRQMACCSAEGTCSSGADDDRSDRMLLRVVMWRLRYSGTDVCRVLYYVHCWVISMTNGTIYTLRVEAMLPKVVEKRV